MTALTEDEIEQYQLQLLQNLGYSYSNGYDIQPEGIRQERESFGEVILKDRLPQAISRINPTIPYDAQYQAQREIFNIASSNLLNNNEIFHKYLTEGITVEYQKNGETRGEPVKLIDWEHPENNEFLAVNQFTVIEDNHNHRPDIVLFINGLPLVVIELKNAANEKANLNAAYNQLQTYKSRIPSLFTYNALLVISDGLSARAGSLTAGFNRFSTWKNPTGENQINELEILTNGLLNKQTLLDLIRHFTVFEKSKTEDLKTGIVSITTIKKIAAYHQYYAVNKAVESIINASSQEGARKGGVLWHTQGSGKSLSMVFLAGKLVLNQNLQNPTIVMLTDRNDLDDQLFDTFAGCQQLLRQDPQQAGDREQVRQLLNTNSGGIIFTTVQKFSPADGETLYPQISPRPNIIVLADEAHRSQYGFTAKQVNVLDAEGNVIGKRTKYGFAKYIRQALPNATFVGFTGTPVEQTDKNTPAIFGEYIDIYDISQAVKDGATVPIYYESRLVQVDLDAAGRQLLDELDEDLSFEELSTTQKAKVKQTKLEAIVGSTKRIKQIAQDIVTHFEARQQVNKGKAMIVTMSRQIAVNLYDAIIQLRPDWHSEDLNLGKIKVVITTSAADEGNLVKHHTSKAQRQNLAQRLKDPENSLELAIVCDMWLTGFDAPCLHTMYIDKPLKSHNLMQAIARINRVYFEKTGGLIVDYLGLATELKKALSFYSQSGGKGDLTLNQEVAVGLLLAKLEIVEQIMSGFTYQHYFEADTGEKLNILKNATNYVAAPNIKDRFLSEVIALSKAHSLAVPHPDAIAASETISFFQAIQASLRKLEGSGDGSGLSNQDIETAIRQVVDQALVSDAVINIFDEAGIKNPDISIISDEFMAEVRGMEHQNLAVELLQKLLKDEVKTRSRTNIVQSRKLSEMLEDALRRYRNQVITVGDVLEELLELAKDTKAANARGEELGLEPYELAFYDALSQNQSAQDVMGVDKLRELAIVLVDRIRKNASIDWNLKESVRSRMKVAVKRLLRQYGYPPDMEALAMELVLEQAKVFTEFTVSINT
ncbi:type I restriction endonuclease subunit R [Nostoc sp. ATCC 53789]|uniref:type I restriction endonuclease subunit R n=1 Tax=Nostoc sp. ATCC 53789 TaxID=76335 RepID=UPI000DEC331F|nr:type I restriction endonuclease subunit R [Nostoc sp. ATCC 53789]QHG21252.1 HsdR family type I site-specific deoxyribonuclease [Nostoc sp. ATCC 53789]RCJ16643.1 restriction endonuclease subunit R [Nostoc sp. ATCC 53789]